MELGNRTQEGGEVVDGEGIKYCKKRERCVDRITTEMIYDLISIPASLLGYTHRKIRQRIVTSMFMALLWDGGILGDFPQFPDTFLCGLNLFLQ